MYVIIYIMKRALVILLLLFPALAFAQPSLEFINISHDGGVVKEGTALQHVFEFKNSGDMELIINRLVPS